MNHKSAIASSMRGTRASKYKSQREAANAVGVSAETIANYESGETCPNVLNAWALADYYGVSLDDLVGRRQTAT